MTEYQPRDFLTAAAMKLGAAFLFATMAVQVRYLGDKFPVGQVIFFRAIFAFIPILIFYAVLGELKKSWHTERFFSHVQRGTLSIASSFCYFGALARLPIVDVTAISFVTPLIVVVPVPGRYTATPPEVRTAPSLMLIVAFFVVPPLVTMAKSSPPLTAPLTFSV